MEEPTYTPTDEQIAEANRILNEFASTRDSEQVLRGDGILSQISREITYTNGFDAENLSRMEEAFIREDFPERLQVTREMIDAGTPGFTFTLNDGWAVNGGWITPPITVEELTPPPDLVILEGEDEDDDEVVEVPTKRTRAPRKKKMDLTSLVTSRFADAPWIPKESYSIAIGGVGGIGSNVAYILVKIGVQSIYIYDFDVVEETNLGGQFYKLSDIGKTKVAAITKNALTINKNIHIVNMGRLVEAASYYFNIVFSCFDNMSARKMLFDRWVEYCDDYKNEINVPRIFIDGRLFS